VCSVEREAWSVLFEARACVADDELRIDVVSIWLAPTVEVCNEVKLKRFDGIVLR
jgi:hypothetical protein